MPTANRAVTTWVEETARLTQPQRIEWLDGSDAEYARLVAEGVRTGVFLPLNSSKHPNSYLHRSHPSDVARTEQCTYICTPTKEEAGPTNNWMAPAEARTILRRLFEGAMRGRTMYVVPYLLGPPGSPFSKIGVELTDSLYVAVSMRIMTRMGTIAWEHLGASGEFVKGWHSLGSMEPQQRYVCHFPQDAEIASINSGYGGNALLGKKCFALRIGSWLGYQQGWLAEHMLIMGIEDPEGRITYLAGAFPSACGKTNLAMIQPTGRYAGWKVWCVGDDIAWLRPGPDGRLYATNPEAGFFGVAPGTNWQSNPNMMRTIDRNTLFTNVGLTADRSVWWEGLPLPDDLSGMQDWQGRPWSPSSGQKAAHPNSRFTAPITQCPVSPPVDPNGVPISGFIFGARRATVVPLVFEAFDWAHGVFLASTLTSETTAAASGAVGQLRHDPMAMLPFCGYNMADYFGHWLRMGARLSAPPKIFRVNWFRRNPQGQLIWPGFSENMRVLRWIVERCADRGEASPAAPERSASFAEASETPIGYVPAPGALDVEGLSISSKDVQDLLTIDQAGWKNEAASQAAFFEPFGERLPRALREQHQRLVQRL